MKPGLLPPMPLQEWDASRLYFQLLCQIAGKTRLKLHPPMNHWWHVPLYLSPRGLTTGGIPHAGAILDIELDIEEQGAVIRFGDGLQGKVPAGHGSIASFYRGFTGALGNIGIEPKIVATPYKCASDEPFATDEIHTNPDWEAIQRAWTILAAIEPIFKEFRGRYLGKCSPVHMFWHSFDLTVTRFSGRRAPDMPGADAVTREAYSHEVNSAGFWFGDENIPEPAFYCYTAPAPEGLAHQPLRPREAYWQELRGAPMALLRYEDWRQMDDLRAALLEFLQSSYEAGANAGNWDREALERREACGSQRK